MTTRSSAFFECPVCGADVPRGAHACPQCGADERTGWNEETAIYDGIDLPDSAFEDDEGPSYKPENPKVNGVPLFWWLVAVVLLALLGLALLR